MGIFITLSDGQIKKALEIANARHNCKHSSFRNKGILMKDINQKSMPHQIGAIGEMAYAIMKGLKVDEELYSKRDEEDFDGIEVKTTTFFGDGEPELKIKIKEYKSKFPRKYVLIRVDRFNLSRVELIGEITRKRFDQIKLVKKYGKDNPWNYVVPASKLYKVR